MNSVPTLSEDGDDSSGTSPGRRLSVLPDKVTRRSQISAAVKKFMDSERGMPRQSLGGFRDVQKRRILNEVINVFQNPSGEPFVLILDPLGAAVLSTQLSMSDIMFPEGPVALLENLQKKRPPMRNMEAVYFIAPDKDSLVRLINDFEDEKRGASYKGAHLVFTSILPEAGVEMIRRSPRLLRHMITFREVQADIFPLESHVVNFGLVGSLQRLYGHGRMNPLNDSSSALYEDIASRLVSVCVTLNEAPMIRYATGNTRSKLICEAFAGRMLAYMRSHEDFEFHHASSTSDFPERATLMIFDRREDLSSPLLHEFTYQAMCMDVLESEVIVGKGQTSFEYSTRDKGVDTKVMFNKLEDDIWRVHRHNHIAEMPSLLARWNKKFRESEDYKLLKNARTLTRPRDQMKLLRTKDHTSELIEMYARHRLVAGKLMEYATANEDPSSGLPLMFMISEVEGQISTGLDGESGKSLSDDKIRQNLIDLLSRFEVGIDHKVRLITLWFIHYGQKYTQEQHQVIWKSCNPELPTTRVNQINQLLFMKVPMNSHGRTKDEKISWREHRAKVFERTAAVQKNNSRSTRIHEPTLCTLVSSHINASLPSEEYKWRDVNRVADPDGDLDPEEPPHWYRPGVFDSWSGAGLDGAHAKKSKSTDRSQKSSGARSLRKHKISNRKGSKVLRFGVKSSGPSSKIGGSETSRKSSFHDEAIVGDADFEFTGPRLIVLVFGGITYAEMRSMYETMQRTKREIIVCCTDIVTPNMFMQSLGQMSAPDMSSDDDSESDGSVGLDDINLDGE